MTAPSSFPSWRPRLARPSRIPCLDLRPTAICAAALAAAVLGIASFATTDEVFDARGLNPNRDFFSMLPYERVDPLTGNLLLTLTDLVLPGNAGFDLAIQRTYNSKIY